MGPLKTNLSVADKYEAFYTGGKIQISADGKHMFCGCGQKVKIVELDTGKISSSLGQEDEEITSFCLSCDDQFLVLATQNLLLRQWNWKEEVLVRSWRAIHSTPVMSMTFDPTSTLLATGGSDSFIKLWDIVQQYCTHNLRGHAGVVRLVRFHPDIARLQLLSAADDYSVRVWNLKTSTCQAVIRDHYSLVTDLHFTDNGNTMYSCGGDSVVLIWDMLKLSVIKTLPIFESVEAIITLDHFPDLDIDSPGNHFVTAGTAGALKVWNAKTGSCVYSNKLLCEETGAVAESKIVIKQSFYCHTLNKIIIVTYDNNILFLNTDFTPHKQYSGHLEEILDLAFIGDEGSHIVVISNSSKVKVFQRDTMECQILSGHSDTVLAVSVCSKKQLFATASKDNTVRVWQFHPEKGNVTCIAVGSGHTQAVHSVALSRMSASRFLLSGSEDLTLKYWSLPSSIHIGPGCPVNLHATVTERAHEKDINFVAVAPNDHFVASASQDKTAKLWSLPDLTLKGVARGHRRGVWCVQFSPVDRCFVTSSADGTIKMWNLADFSCLQTFEGHDSSVLKVLFISTGKQLVSSDSEGLLKLWTLKTNECEKSLEAHENKVWALAIHPSEDILLTGGADSTIITWKDTSEEELQLAQEEKIKLVLQEQQLSNYIQEKKLLKALGLAISLGKPYRVLTMLKDILQTSTGMKDLEETLTKLKLDQIGSILQYAAQWNTNSKHCHCAHAVINIILRTFSPDELLTLPNIQNTLESLLPYTERHFQRMNRLEQQTTFVDYTWKCMKMGT